MIKLNSTANVLHHSLPYSGSASKRLQQWQTPDIIPAYEWAFWLNLWFAMYDRLSSHFPKWSSSCYQKQNKTRGGQTRASARRALTTSHRFGTQKSESVQNRCGEGSPPSPCEVVMRRRSERGQRGENLREGDKSEVLRAVNNSNNHLLADSVFTKCDRCLLFCFPLFISVICT